MVIEKVTSHEKRRSIWSNFFELEDEFHEMDKEHTTEKEKLTALAGVCIYDRFPW